MIRIIIPLFAGIVLGTYYGIANYLILIVLWIILFLLLASYKKKSSNYYGFSLLVLLFFAVFGIFLIQWHTKTIQPPKQISKHYVKAVVKNSPEVKGKSVAIVLQIKSLYNQGYIQSTNFKTLSYFPKDSTLLHLQYGDTIITKLKFRPLKKSGNPYVFEYSDFLKSRQIYNQGIGYDNTVCLLGRPKFSLMRSAKATQAYLAKKLRAYIHDNNTASFLQAITLGDKSTLSPKLKANFTTTGVVHIMAVSGLHVGIIFLLINILLRPFRSSNTERIIVVLISLMVIWGFAFISGLSISVLRASVMFSLLQLSLLSMRPYKIYNTIACSAFLLLIISPFYLFKIGFHLSYIAVLSIVAFVPILEWRIKNNFANKLKTLILVSLSAQIGIAPLILLYFHHLPTYFLPTNIIVLLLAPFMLGGGLIVLIFSAFPLLATFLGTITSYITSFCINFVKFIASMPYNNILNYNMDSFLMLLCYCLLLLLLIYYYIKKLRIFYTLLGVFLITICYISLNNFIEKRQSLFVLHYTNNNTLCSVISGKNMQVLYSQYPSEKDQTFIMSPLQEALNIDSIAYIDIKNSSFDVKNIFIKRKNHFLYKGQHIVLAKSRLGSLTSPKIIDYLIFTKTSDYINSLKIYKPSCVILDTSLSFQKKYNIKQKLASMNIKVYDVQEQGAFILR